MRTGKDRVQVEAVNSPVNIGDARVHPGDLLRGDADGVLVIPRAHEDAVLAAAEEIDAIEQQIRAAINDGKTLAEARRQLGYHQLQTRRSRRSIGSAGFRRFLFEEGPLNLSN